tara:strand:- start:763 stop:1026 length:264 start_codon:yes stop_codon:yes gene_type:complete
MPRYVYRCSDCNGEFQTIHSIKDTLSVCELCGVENNIVRIPQITTSPIKNKTSNKKVGSFVNESIEDARVELNQYKKEILERSPQND